MIDLEDNIWSFGGGSYGQLGLGDQVDRFKPTQIANLKAKFVACGWDHTMIIDSQGNVWSFGNNSEGQLGLGNKKERPHPTQIPNLKARAVGCGNTHTLVIDKEGNIWSFGADYCGQLGLGSNKQPAVGTALPVRITGASATIPTKILNLKAKSVACGGSYTVVIS